MSTMGVPPPRLVSGDLGCLRKTSCWVLSCQLSGGRRLREGRKGVGVVAGAGVRPLASGVGVPQEVGGVRAGASSRLRCVGARSAWASSLGTLDAGGGALLLFSRPCQG